MSNSCIVQYDKKLKPTLKSAIIYFYNYLISAKKNKEKNIQTLLNDYLKNFFNGNQSIINDQFLADLEEILNNFKEEELNIILDKTDCKTINDFLNKFRSLLDTKIKILKKQKNDDSLDIETEEQQIEDNKKPVNITYKRAKSEVFAGQISAQQYLIHQFDENIFQVAFLDITKGQYVLDEKTLNDNILIYKNKLYKTLVNFINKQIDVKYNDTLYNNQRILNIEIFEVFQQMQEYLQKQIKDDNIADIITQQYSSILNNKSSEILDAINAYFQLKYFDDMLYESYGKTISVRPGYKNIETGLQKYIFKRDDAHERKDWNENESKSAVDNTAKFSKVVLNHIPMIKLVGEDHIKSKIEFVGATRFITAITNLFSQISKIDKETFGSEFKSYLEKFDSSSTYYTYKLFELLSTNDNIQKSLISRNILIQDDIDTIYSVYDFIYRNLKDQNAIKKSEQKSVSEIELMNISNNLKYGKYSIVSDIAGLVNNISKSEYSETVSDSKGATEIITRQPYNSRKTSMLYVDDVNSSIFQYSISILDEKTKAKKFKYNNNNEVQFSNKYGTINFKIDTKQKNVLLQSRFEIKDITITLKGKKITFKDGKELAKYISEHASELRYNTNFADESESTKLLKMILKITDDYILTDFLSEEGIQKFKYFVDICSAEEHGDYIMDLLIYSAKSAIVMNIYKEMKSKGTKMEQYKQFLKQHITSIEGDEKKYLVENNGIAYFRIIPANTEWVDKFDQAFLILKGKIYSSVSKNLEGNNDANTSTQYLGAKIQYISYKAAKAQKEVQKENEEIDKYNENAKENGEPLKRKKPDTTTSSLLFVQKPNLVKRCVVNSGAETRYGKVKLVKNFTEQEIFYNAIVNNFLLRLVSDESNGSVFLQPTTYSDKTKIINYEIKISDYIKNTSESLIQLYCDTVGQAAKNQELNIVYKFNQLFENENFENIEDVDRFLRQKKFTEQQLVDEAQKKNIRLKLDLDYRNIKINEKSFVVANETIGYKAKEIDIEVAKKRFENAKKDFIKNLIDSNINFYIDYSETALFNKGIDNISLSNLIKTSNHPLLRTIAYFYESSKEQDEYGHNWVENNKLKITNEKGELNPLLEKYFYISSVFENNLRLELTGFETNHPDKSFYKSSWNSIIANINKNGEIIKDSVLSDVKKIQIIKEAKIIYSTNSQYFSDNIKNLNIDNNLTLQEIQYHINNGGKIIVSQDAILTQEIKEYLESQKNVELQNIENNTENLTVYDLLSQDNLIKLSNLNPDENEMYKQAKIVADNMLNIIINVSQGTQLKRNVIIPATSYLMHANEFRGIGAKTKVAFIRDVPAIVYNFTGKIDTEDSMDGSAFTTAEQSILENGGLQSQEVGLDKKTIWHHFDNETGTSGLMKFAAYAITNARIKQSMQSSIQLYNIYKKMTNLQWNVADKDWNLCKTYKPSLGRRASVGINFLQDILNGKDLMYKTYDEDGISEIRKILDFGIDKNGNYYTVEYKVNEITKNIDLDSKTIVYHFYDEKGNHFTNSDGNTPENLHTINSNFELWLAMGGYQSVDISENDFVDSESSHLAVVAFMNKIVMLPENAKMEDKYIVSQETYYQPLKHHFIGYLCNNSAMKQGVENINSAERWENDEDLNYTELDSDGLGVQMDADHDVDMDAVMKEFSQVITALTAGGYYHGNVKQIYKVLQIISDNSSALEKQSINNLLKDLESNDSQARSDAYDMLVRLLVDALDSRSNNGLTDDIVRSVNKKFGKNLNHQADKVKLPISDQNIYSRLLPTLANIINQKSIKRPFPGSGCVMVPGYNIMQYFQIGKKQYMFSDLVEKALDYFYDNNIEIPSRQDTRNFEKELVTTYLEAEQKKIELQDNTDEFIPSDIVNITNNKGNIIKIIDLDEIKKYYSFKDFVKTLIGTGVFNAEISYNSLNEEQKNIIKALGISEGEFDQLKSANQDGGIKFQLNVTRPKNLAPAKITFTAEIGNNKYVKMNVFDIPAVRRNILDNTKENELAARQAFRDLKNRFFINEAGEKVYIQGLSNEAAECIAPSMYGNKFGIKSKSVAAIFDEGVQAFKIRYQNPRDSKNYDLCFNSNGGEDIYISFNRGEQEGIPEPYGNGTYTKFEDGKYKVYLVNGKNIKLFQVGEYVEQPKYRIEDNKIYDEKGNIIEKGKFKEFNGKVYQYVEFITKYNIYENTTDYAGNLKGFSKFDKYYISQKNIAVCYGEKTDEYYAMISNLLDQIYQTQQFVGIKFNPKMYDKDLNLDRSYYITSYVKNMKSLDYKFRKTVLNDLVEDLKNRQNERRQNKEKLKEEYENGNEEIQNQIREKTKQYYHEISEERFVSWQQSLYYTAARIPAQNLQSFMQMRVVAYTGGTKNVVHVSHWQTWLQGSDYK